MALSGVGCKYIWFFSRFKGTGSRDGSGFWWHVWLGTRRILCPGFLTPYWSAAFGTFLKVSALASHWLEDCANFANFYANAGGNWQIQHDPLWVQYRQQANPLIKSFERNFFYKKSPRPLFRSKTNHTCHQKPNPSRDIGSPFKYGTALILYR